MKDLVIIPEHNQPKELSYISFDDLILAIKNPKITLSTFTAEAARQLKDKLPLFYGCEFLSEHISSDYVTDYNYIIVDYDDTDKSKMIEFLEVFDINHVMYTSINHKLKGTKDRFRIIFPLDGVISKEQWDVLALSFNNLTGFHRHTIFSTADKSTFTSNRGFYIPVKTEVYDYSIYLSGTNLSFKSLLQEYRGNITRKNKQAMKLVKIQSEATPASKQIVQDRIIAETKALSIDWTRDGVNSNILGAGKGLNKHIASMVGKLKRSGHSEDEAENFIHNFRDVTKTKKKEWTACVRKFYRRGNENCN